MAIKVSKTALLILSVALVILLAASHIIYSRLNETILIQVVQQQNMQTNILIQRIFAGEKELYNVKKELEKTKDELSKAIAKSNAVITVTPATENK